MKNPFRKILDTHLDIFRLKDCGEPKYVMMLTEVESRIILHERYLDGISERRKILPLITLVFPLSISMLLLEAIKNVWIVLPLFFISLIPHGIFYFKEIRKERRYVDEKLRGITTGENNE